MDFITLIFIIVFISKLIKKSKEQESKKETKSYQSYESYKSYENYDSPKRQEQRQKAMENIERAKQRAKKAASEIKEIMEIQEEYPHADASRIFLERKGHRKTNSAMKQVYEGKKEADNTSILQRAKANAQEYEENVTLTSMEREHNHSERVSAAEHYHLEDELRGDTLETIEDLMIKGYEGHLCFERDFVGEAMDMISRFTVPTDIPFDCEIKY